MTDSTMEAHCVCMDTYSVNKKEETITTPPPRLVSTWTTGFTPPNWREQLKGVDDFENGRNLRRFGVYL
ncbi:hypothetical protein ABKN59_010988 [Abortiporus biennis]